MNGSNNSSIIKSRHKVPSCLVRFALKGMTDKKIGLAGTQRRSIPSHETKCCIWKSLRGKVHVLKKIFEIPSCVITSQNSCRFWHRNLLRRQSTLTLPI